MQAFDAANQMSAATLPTRFVAKGSAADGLGSRATLTANLTAAASPGDQIIAASTTAEATAVSAPAGWVNVGTYTYSGIKVALFRKTASGGETSVTLSYPAASATSPQTKTMAAVVYGNIDPVNPIDTQGSATAPGASSGPVSVTVGSINPTGANDRLLLIEGAQGLLPPAGTWSSTMAQVVQIDGSPMNISTGIADETLNSAGPTGPRTATYSGAGASTPAVGILLALRASTTSYGYDPQGNRSTRQPQAGAATNYSYDQANRLSSLSGTASVSYTYRGDGLRATKTIGSATTTFGWDESGTLPLLLTENTAGEQTNYLYGPGGRLIEQIQPRPYVTYVAGGTKEDKTPLTTTTTATWAPAAEKDDLIIVATAVNDGATVNVPAGYTLIRDSYGSGNTIRVAVFRKKADGGESSVTLTYQSGTPQPARTVAVAVYRNVDPNGDPLDGTSDAGGTQTINLPSITTTDRGDQLIAVAGAQSYWPISSTWTPPAAMTIRQQSPVGAVNNSTMIADKTAGTPGATGDQTITYGNTGSVRGVLIALRRIPTIPVFYYHPDQLGSTRLLTDNNGQVAATYTYNPYGELTATTTTPSVNNPFRYAGQYTDPETGLQYLRARYYDPTTAQFLNRDPIESVTREPYQYAGNNPLNGTDPSGLFVHKKVVGFISDNRAAIIDVGTALGAAAVTTACVASVACGLGVGAVGLAAVGLTGASAQIAADRAPGGSGQMSVGEAFFRSGFSTASGATCALLFTQGCFGSAALPARAGMLGSNWARLGLPRLFPGLFMADLFVLKQGLLQMFPDC